MLSIQLPARRQLPFHCDTSLGLTQALLVHDTLQGLPLNERHVEVLGMFVSGSVYCECMFLHKLFVKHGIAGKWQKTSR